MCAHYATLDADQQKLFLTNVFSQILTFKSQKYQDNVSGLITGRQGHKTYYVQSKSMQVLEVLKNSSVQFIYDKNNEENCYDFLFDAEFNSPILEKLRDLQEKDQNVQLSETNEVP